MADRGRARAGCHGPANTVWHLPRLDGRARLVAHLRASSHAGHLPERGQPWAGPCRRSGHRAPPSGTRGHRRPVFRAVTLEPALLPSILAAEGLDEETKEMARQRRTFALG